MARPSPSGGLRPPTYDFDGEGVLAAAAADRAMEDGAAIPPRPHPVTNTSSPSAWPCPGTGGDTATLPASPLVPRASAFAKPEEPVDKLPKRATGLGRARAWPLGTAGVRPQVRLWHRPESAPHPKSPGSSLLTEPKVSRLLTQWRELRLSHGRLRARVVSTGGGPPNPLRTMAAGGCSRRRGQRARGVEAATAPPWHCPCVRATPGAAHAHKRGRGGHAGALPTRSAWAHPGGPASRERGVKCLKIRSPCPQTVAGVPREEGQQQSEGGRAARPVPEGPGLPPSHLSGQPNGAARTTGQRGVGASQSKWAKTLG